MALNIKNERVHALAREAAARTGKSQTAVLADALEMLLASLAEQSDDERVARDQRTWAWFRSLPPVSEEDRAAARAYAEEMYDEATGLSR